MGIGFVTPGGGGGGAPTGPAGGDLAGAYPNPTVSGVLGQPATAYGETYWVSPTGNATSSGQVPTSPTTLATAAAAVSAGDIIVLGAGDYPSVTLTTACTLTTYAPQSSLVVEAGARITGVLNIEAPNCRVHGLELVGGVLDTTGQTGLGKTTFENCTIIGNTIVEDANTTIIEMLSCTHTLVQFSATNAGATFVAYNTTFGGTVQNSTTGTLAVEAYDSEFAAVDQNAAGTLAVELRNCRLSGGITRSLGAVSSVYVKGSSLGGGIDATGAAAGTVTILASDYDASASLINPTQRSTTSLYVGRELNYNFRLSPSVTANAPANKVLYLSLASALNPISIDPAHNYQFDISWTFQVSSNNTSGWFDLEINGLGSPSGPLVILPGLSGAQVPQTLTSTLPGVVFAPGGTLYVDLFFAKNSGTGDVTIQSGYMTIKRVD